MIFHAIHCLYRHAKVLQKTCRHSDQSYHADVRHRGEAASSLVVAEAIVCASDLFLLNEYPIRICLHKLEAQHAGCT